MNDVQPMAIYNYDDDDVKAEVERVKHCGSSAWKIRKCPSV